MELHAALEVPCNVFHLKSLHSCLLISRKSKKCTFNLKIGFLFFTLKFHIAWSFSPCVSEQTVLQTRTSAASPMTEHRMFCCCKVWIISIKVSTYSRTPLYVPDIRLIWTLQYIITDSFLCHWGKPLHSLGPGSAVGEKGQKPGSSRKNIGEQRA